MSQPPHTKQAGISVLSAGHAFRETSSVSTKAEAKSSTTVETDRSSNKLLVRNASPVGRGRSHASEVLFFGEVAQNARASYRARTLTGPCGAFMVSWENSIVAKRMQDSLRSLGAKRLMEVTNVVEYQQLRPDEQLFAEGDNSEVRVFAKGEITTATKGS